MKTTKINVIFVRGIELSTFTEKLKEIGEGPKFALSILRGQPLKSGFGIRGTALSWFASYLSNRYQQILIDGSLSMNFELSYGVPQGSCLSPLLFVLYASKIFQIVDKHLPSIHCYANDSQLYLSFCPNASVSQDVALTRMESCIDDIRS